MRHTLLALLAAIAIIAQPAAAKRYERSEVVPFIPLRDGLTVAEEVLQNEDRAGLQCKSARNLVTNGGECWIFSFVSENEETYVVEVYSGRRVRHGTLLAYTFRAEKELKQLSPRKDNRENENEGVRQQSSELSPAAVASDEA